LPPAGCSIVFEYIVIGLAAIGFDIMQILQSAAGISANHDDAIGCFADDGRNR
jgi:hypothetical protein